MIWDRIILDFVLPSLRGDAELTAAIGGAQHIYTAQSTRPVRVPSVEWLVLDDVLQEVMNPIRLQVDYWAPHPGVAATIERRIRAVLHRDTRRTVAGINMATLYEDSWTPDAPTGVIHRSLRFRLEPVRSRAASAA